MTLRVLIVYTRKDLVTNLFFVKQLSDSLEKAGRDATVISTESLSFATIEQLEHLKESTSLVIFRSRDVALSKKMGEMGFKIINNPSLLELATDKLKTYEFCLSHSLPTIQTTTVEQSIEATLPHKVPLVIKDRYGHGGSSVVLLDTKDDVHTHLSNKALHLFVAQPFIDDVLCEWRAYVIGRQIKYWVKKTPKSGDFRANLSQGAKIEKKRPPDQIRSLVEQVVCYLGEGAYGVDILQTRHGNLLGEIEDPVGFRSLYRLNLTDITETLASYFISVSGHD